MALKVFFRGDSRRPGADAIFTNGFTKRSPTKKIAYRSSGTEGVAGDIEPDTGVCLSGRLVAAALFPLKFEDEDDPPDTYIYLVAMDPAALYNTHSKQVIQSLKGVKAGIGAATAMWPLYGHELCADSVPGTSVIAAVECSRVWAGEDFSSGGTYTLKTLFHNPSCTVEASIKQSGMDFIAGELNNHRQGALPVGTSGYHKSDKQ